MLRPRAFGATALEALTRSAAFVLVPALLAGCGQAAPTETPFAQQAEGLATYTDSRAWSRKPPMFEPQDVPQFVNVTFDDNFVSGLGDVSGGMTWATTFFGTLQNPAGSSYAPTFDGTPVRTTFYNNCVYLDDDGTRKSWITAREAGHEMANHTVNHPQGVMFGEQAWTDEIGPCTAALTNPDRGVGIGVDDVRGFRAPYLGYSGALFGVLKAQGLWYDTSVQSCWAAGDDGKNCAWPYTLDQGSSDGVDLTAKFQTPMVPPTSGLWEMTPTVLFVPPDELAAQYGFSAGLRGRIPTDMPTPSYYEASTGRIAPLDVTMFADAKMTPAETLATLKYTLDLHLQGNRAPFIFIAHTHVYASNWGAGPNAQSVEERQKVIEDFVHYALTKAEVRMRPVADMLKWMREPHPMNGVVTYVPPVGGAGAGGGAGMPSGGSAGAPSGGVGGASGGAGTPITGSSGTTSGQGSDDSNDKACACRAPGSNARAGSSSFTSLALIALGLLAARRKMAPAS